MESVFVLLACLFERLREPLHAHVALLGVLCKRFEYHFLDRFGQRRVLLSQGWRWGREVLVDNLPCRPLERTYPTEPLVGDDAQGILVAGKARSSMELLGSHVGEGARHLLGREQFGHRGKQREAKIAE